MSNPRKTVNQDPPTNKESSIQYRNDPPILISKLLGSKRAGLEYNRGLPPDSLLLIR